jgi:two-component system cell cycle response regulator
LAVVRAALDGFGELEPEAGDSVLHEAGARLAHTLRSGDVIVRWDDSGFLMMLPDTDREGTFRAAERLRRSIAAAPFTAGPQTLDITVSVGWADWRGEDPSEFKLRVDRSLGQAQEAGGDVVRPETY